MEARLVPVNAVIGLVLSDGLNRAILAERGFEIAGLEIPCVVGEAKKVVVDVVLVNRGTGQLLACEAKCGANVVPEQAVRYSELQARTVVRSASVTLTARVDPTLEVVYVALAEHRDRILLSLRGVGVNCPVLSVSSQQIELSNGEFASTMLQAAFSSPLRLEAAVARSIPFDHESGPDIIKPYVNAAMIAELSRPVQMVSIGHLTENIAQHYVLYGAAAQGRLRKTVGQLACDIAKDYPESFQYVGAVANRGAYVKLLHSPEKNDPRGRTQGYQRLARQGRSTRRRPEAPGQGNLLDHLDKAGDDEAIAESDEGVDEG